MYVLVYACYSCTRTSRLTPAFVFLHLDRSSFESRPPQATSESLAQLQAGVDEVKKEIAAREARHKEVTAAIQGQEQMKRERLDEAKDAVNKLHALEMELAQTKAAREKETDCLAALEQSKTKVRKDLVPRPRFLTPFVLGPMSPPLPPRGVASRCFVPHAASHFSVLASSAIASLFVHFSELTTSTCPILALLFLTTHTHIHTHTHINLLAFSLSRPRTSS